MRGLRVGACWLSIACGPGAGADHETSTGPGATESGASSGPGLTTTAAADSSGSTSGTAGTSGPGTSSDASSSGSTFDRGDDDPSCGFGCLNEGNGLLPCSVFAQDCPAGQKCMPYDREGSGTWTGTTCSPISASPGSVGDPCQVEDSPLSGVDDCDIGLACWPEDSGTLEGTCEDLCTGNKRSPLCEATCDFCATDAEGFFALCLSPCDPLAPACPGEQQCQRVFDGFSCVLPPGPALPVGEPCSSDLECVQGSVCEPGAAGTCRAAACCTAACALDDPSTCTAQPGTTCQSIAGGVGDRSCDVTPVGACVPL